MLASANSPQYSWQERFVALSIAASSDAVAIVAATCVASVKRVSCRPRYGRVASIRRVSAVRSASIFRFPASRFAASWCVCMPQAKVATAKRGLIGFNQDSRWLDTLPLKGPPSRSSSVRRTMFRPIRLTRRTGLTVPHKTPAKTDPFTPNFFSHGTLRRRGAFIVASYTDRHKNLHLKARPPGCGRPRDGG